MAVKVRCPECQHEMSLKTLKAGRFKPTCSQCKSPFALTITAGDNPELRVAKLPADKGQASVDAKQSIKSVATSVAEPSAEETIAQPSSLNTAQPSLENTAQPSSLNTAQPSLGSAVRELQASGNIAGGDQTLEHVAGQTKNSAAAFSVSPGASSRAPKPTTEVAEATMTVEQGGTAIPTKPSGSMPRATGQPSTPLPERLGGYRILKELGRGGMGAVYLARQLSLNRNVAVKTIQNDWSANPRAVARFIREAYAAAQLTHHNVVQIYDLGQDSGINFFSMELVEGGSLDDLLKRQGQLNPKQAATYIVQAARGLRFAHEHGMIHRDIKPANLMLTSDSLVKVADLGLVKTPSLGEEEDAESSEDASLLRASARSHVTGAGSTLGTPAYMPPEQAEDATQVDHRADIYSLGCTFYALLVGEPPYGKRSAIEVLSKIKTEPIVRVDTLVKGVPPQLASIVERMTAKLPADRYQSLDEVIQELEQFLNAGADQSRQSADQLKQAADKLRALPSARLRSLVPMAIGALLLVVMLIGLVVSWRLSMLGALSLILTPAFITLGNGLIGERSPITQRFRALLTTAKLSSWISWALGLIVLLTIIALTGLFFWVLAAMVVSAALATGYTFVVTRTYQRERQPIIDQAKEVVREMRLQGLEESRIAAFISEFAGDHWAGLLEALFGYESMRSQRAALAGAGRTRTAWREMLIDRLDAILTARREEREQRMLTKVEVASLKAAGVDKKQAEEQAAAMATSLVSAATMTRQIADQAMSSGKVDAAANRARIREMMATARSGKPPTIMKRASLVTSQLLNNLFGAQLRFAIGSLILLGCALWAHQNNLFDRSKLNAVGSALQSSVEKVSQNTTDLETGQAVATQVGKKLGSVIGQTRALNLPLVGAYFTSFAPGIIGLLIILSAGVGSWRWTMFAAPAAAITLLGPQFGVPSLGFDHGAAWLSCGIGAVLMIVPVIIKPLR